MTGSKPFRFENTCPKCGSHLTLREGENNDFLACPRFPACRYTQSLKGNEVETLKIYQPPSPYCEKCNHTGLLPFVKKGKVIPHAFIDCDCKPEETEHYFPLKPEDIDYPVSYDFYRGLCQYHGWPDLGDDRVPEEPSLEDFTGRIESLKSRSSPGRKEIDSLKGEIRNTRTKLYAHIEKSTKKKVSKYD